MIRFAFALKESDLWGYSKLGIRVWSHVCLLSVAVVCHSAWHLSHWLIHSVTTGILMAVKACPQSPRLREDPDHHKLAAAVLSTVLSTEAGSEGASWRKKTFNSKPER